MWTVLFRFLLYRVLANKMFMELYILLYMTCAAARLFSKYITRRMLLLDIHSGKIYIYIVFFLLLFLGRNLGSHFPSRLDKHRCTSTAFVCIKKSNCFKMFCFPTMRIPLWRLVKRKIRVHTSRVVVSKSVGG